MTNAERIAALRRCSYTTVAGVDREDGYCKPCSYFAEDTSDITCIDRMMIDAADALEAAEKRIARLEEDLKTREAEREIMQDTIKVCEKRIAELEDEIKNLENAYIAELTQAHINVQRSAKIYREWYEAVGSKRGKDNEKA